MNLNPLSSISLSMRSNSGPSKPSTSVSADEIQELCELLSQLRAFGHISRSPTAPVPVAPAIPVGPVVPAVVPAAPAPAAALQANEAEDINPADLDAGGAVFCCPSCSNVHHMVPLMQSNDLPPLAVANAAPAPPLQRTGLFSAAEGNIGQRWYAVIVGHQVGVFQDWDNLVDGLVRSVPGGRCKSFVTFADAEAHYNARLDVVRIHT
ncbi:hypothetical protein BDN71DRAFT_1497494 [Pleurotus eryngii]|uniref:Ribonuclease H1 N-terminal domain-containing protein n=1 Tax=Pleurotus eryngii TaxID=5323 RepID=A0A9P5ZRA7_PLEER|nr:hypothetical protein BDN71DRAFT_1497494 [Pleurotus eryngii]